MWHNNTLFVPAGNNTPGTASANHEKINNDLRHHACPLCGSINIGVIGLLSYSNIIFADTRVELQHIPELWLCDGCHSGWTQNAIREEDAARLYSLKRSGRWTSPLTLDERRPKKMIMAIRRHVKSGMRVLDIGCGNGQLLDYLRSLNCETYGIEYSTELLDACKKKGHTCYQNIAELEGQKGFDCIFLIDTIEHMYDVQDFLQRMNGLLVKGGSIFILTGDITSLPFRLFKERWWYIQYPEHIIFPSVKYLSSFPGYCMKDIVHTFAFRAYEKMGIRKMARLVYHLLDARTAGRDCSLPDHYFIVLEK